MRRLSLVLPAILCVLVVACGPTPVATTPAGGTITPGEPGATTPGGPGGTTPPAATSAPAATQSGGGAAALPASCAAGFIAYLKALEPLVAGFDPATGTMQELSNLDQKRAELGFQLMDANGGSATYSCSDVSLEFNYFDARSPWAAIHQLVAAEAPGAAGFLQATEKVAAIDDDVLADHGMASCEDAAAKIKADVAAFMGDGAKTAGDLPVDTAVGLLGLYNAYNTEVRDGRCTNSLGNAEFGFMSVF